MPEFAADQQFSISVNKPLNDFMLAKSKLNLITKPVLVGPITFLHLSHIIGSGDLDGDKLDNLNYLDALLTQYVKVMEMLSR